MAVESSQDMFNDIFFFSIVLGGTLLSEVIGAPQYVRQMLTSMKEEINSNTIIVGDFNTPHTPMDRSTKQN